jgi:DNA-binding PadR family transcriptional regulator
MENQRLTRRQQEFLRALVDLYQEQEEAIHYTLVAEHLGVGRVTSYEMLRLLEERGLVHREFQRLEEDRGPGRSPVSFRPTPLAVAALADLGMSVRISEEWTRVKTQILEKLRKGKSRDHDDFLKELLDRLPRRRSPDVYLTETVTAVILELHSLREFADARRLRNMLGRIGLPGELDLNAIPGLSAGLSLVERFNKQLSKVLLNQASKYQSFLSELSAEKRRLLAEFTREVVKIVGG